MSTHLARIVQQLAVAHRIYSLHPDPLLKSAIALLGQALSEDTLSPQQAHAFTLVDNLRRSAAALYNDPAFLPDDVKEEW